MKNPYYRLFLYRKIQGTLVRICPVESWFSTTRKREAERMANRINKQNGWSVDRFVGAEK